MRFRIFTAIALFAALLFSGLPIVDLNPVSIAIRFGLLFALLLVAGAITAIRAYKTR